MNNNRDLKFAFYAGLITAFLFLPILANLKLLNIYLAVAVILGWPLLTILGMWITEKLMSRILWLYQFAKFVVTGFMNTALDMGLLNLLSYSTGIYSGKYIVVLNSISFAVAVTNSYFWNKHWTFERAEGARAAEYLKFIAVSAIGLALSGVIVYAMTTFVPTDGFSPALLENIAKIVATAAVLFWNFAGFKFFVFKA